MRCVGKGTIAVAGLLLGAAIIGCSSPDQKAQELNAQAKRAWARTDTLSEKTTKLVEKQNKLYAAYRPSQQGEAFVKQMSALDRQISAQLRAEAEESSKVAALLRKAKSAAVSPEMKKYVDMELSAIGMLQKSTALGVKMAAAKIDSGTGSQGPSVPDIDPGMSEAEINDALRASEKDMQKWVDEQDAALTAQVDAASKVFSQWSDAVGKYAQLKAEAEAYGVENGLSE